MFLESEWVDVDKTASSYGSNHSNSNSHSSPFNNHANESIEMSINMEVSMRIELFLTVKSNYFFKMNIENHFFFFFMGFVFVLYF